MGAGEFVRVRVGARVTLGLNESLPVVGVLGGILLLLIERVGSVVFRLVFILFVLLGLCFLLGLLLFFGLLGRGPLLLKLFERTEMAMK